MTIKFNKQVSAVGCHFGGVIGCIRCSVSNLVGFTRVGSNPVVGTINHKSTASSAVHPPKVGK